MTKAIASILFPTSAVVFLVCLLAAPASAQDPVTLANDEWPPFILAGGNGGISKRLVCEALERSGHECEVAIESWDVVLEKTRTGEIDGIAAAWRDADREAFLLFSEPYLTNQIVPVVRTDSNKAIESIGDLAGLRIALVSDYAYGAEITAATSTFETVKARNSAAALEHVRLRRADVALIDELEARDRLGSSRSPDMKALLAVLAFRSLHFAVSRAHPNAEQLLADFNRAYASMLADGTVNEILDVDWLATDFGGTGNVNVVMRNNADLDDLANPSEEGSMYAIDQSQYEWLGHRKLDDDSVKYQVGGETYSSLQSALNNAFGREMVCEHREYSSTFDCSDLLKNR